MHSPTNACHAPANEADVFRSHFENGQWHWSYHNPRGRLLARGAERADRWAAHRALLAAIADYCTSGEVEEEDEPSWPGDPSAGDAEA
ncbi:MAG TPA: hypothetical protein VMV10_10020 [Pirellulales bacterium]|nr:hypothetical protein [Pirellulales bacterium]